MGQKLSTFTMLIMLLLPAPTWAENGSMCQVVQREVQAYLQTGASCPCPYSRAHDGHLCGQRSAWAKSGGAALRCFTDDQAARTAGPAMTRRPDAACGDGDEIARPARLRADEVLTAGLVGAE